MFVLYNFAPCVAVTAVIFPFLKTTYKRFTARKVEKKAKTANFSCTMRVQTSYKHQESLVAPRAHSHFCCRSVFPLHGAVVRSHGLGLRPASTFPPTGIRLWGTKDKTKAEILGYVYCSSGSGNIRSEGREEAAARLIFLFFVFRILFIRSDLNHQLARALHHDNNEAKAQKACSRYER